MAEGWTKTIPCRYFSNGFCREGQNCRYAHIRRSADEGSPRNLSRSSCSTATSNRQFSGSCPGTSQASTSSCLFFKRGTCVYGSSCRFAHENMQSSNESLTHNWRVNNESEDESNQENATSDSLSEASASDFVLSKELSKRQNTEVESNGFSLKYSGPTNPINRLIETNNEKNESSELENEKWVNAPEFVPLSLDNCDIPTTTEEASKTYAEALNAKSQSSNNSTRNNQLANPQIQLCPYLQTGECKYGDVCSYLHGDICELCSCAVLNPFNEAQRKQHVNECIKQHEKDMELSFAVARSRDKQCGICFEVVLDKPREQRFGILPNCNHCFCLECIRKWRQSTQFENKIIRACPECRVTSNFVCPSMYWVDGKEEKDQLINDYRLALSLKDCKYFKSGVGKCPFGNKCFYLHAYPDGTKTDVGPPPRQRRAQTEDGEMDFLQRFILWDFFGERENRWLYNFEDIEDIVAFFSDSDDSDTSDYDFW